jgi:hypothetical protein
MPHPTEGSLEWYEAIARSHFRCAVQKRRFVIPQLTPDDHLAKAAEAEAKADALRRKSARVERAEPSPEPEPRKPVPADRCAAGETQLPLGLIVP